MNHGRKSRQESISIKESNLERSILKSLTCDIDKKNDSTCRNFLSKNLNF